MSSGNGVARALDAGEACPIDPRQRPGECRTIHAQLEEIFGTLREHGRGIRRVSRAQTRVLNVLEELGQHLARLNAAHAIRTPTVTKAKGTKGKGRKG
jgi:hypothetical protein